MYKKKDVIINCKGKAIFVSKSDERGKYRITLVQSRGQWKPRKLTNRAKKYLQKANSVYDLPSTEETINWMHAVCEYLVKSTCIKNAKERNFVGWPTLNERNVEKYYQKNETPKGHINQTRNNVQSTKPIFSNFFVTSPLPESFKNKNIKHKRYLNAAQNSLSLKTTADSNPLRSTIQQHRKAERCGT